MQSIFDTETRNALIRRIETLDEQSARQWGKMTVNQMVNHCILADEHFLGKKEYKRGFLGYIFGKAGLRSILKKERPFKPGTPTSKAFLVTETGGDLPALKAQWITQINEFAQFAKPDITHWFFGKMNRDEVGQFVYKHTDHHLRQFNA